MRDKRFRTRNERCREQGIRQCDLAGKTIAGIVARPGPNGHPVVMMLQFDDGTCLEFVTPAGERELKRQAGQAPGQGSAGDLPEPQLALAV